MSETASAIAQIRAFNRFYTDLIGLLDKHLLHSDYSLAEARILYEIQASQPISASHIMASMHIDKSYLSRVLKKLERDKLIRKQSSARDARTTLLSLTPEGLAVFTTLNQASDEQINALLRSLPAAQHQELVQHMQAIITILRPAP
ncbi:MarR family transcriptional regulator [Hymenobacter sp. YC55]|uniref:MarR family winged helix-turn-helix transcriptional regulator n=1 Tax=Hymenobacter sp. YC55 TaxID=3034019 RepID=UPI0023F6B5DA|nr:MarR family transcriptional regulator [Hymenobacter sp. YC55]MDF7814957.1 MarR family transcriptional regulator [Hymenobacter sp. YC55]